ncbi:hypothetical protein [Novosphingobium sp. TCA1]|uniref:Uncharacterized protein n=1 Tax=Novosphingobium pentaromativorans TaxID=205844 RepID=A0A2W5NQF4_9SPHN|nr:hypothetical protein [Novosphingobium sp. TCA1]PZQ54319.1 MAG: hypothetical protein DI555_12890 [Novosphingobium pentaromativorans]GFE74726.1 hypothetical protein NTCA1_23750 [Novosphingobium sp. TCA1]
MTDFALGLAILAASGLAASGLAPSGLAANLPATTENEELAALTGRDAVERLAGNTLEEDDSEAPGAHIIYLKPGGVARMREHGKHGNGKPVIKQRWTISPDGLLCVSDGRGPEDRDTECASISISGDRVEMSVPDLDEPLTARLLSGNPYKL